MRSFVNKNVVFTLLVTFVLYVAPLPARGGDTLVAGKASSNEAAGWRGDGQASRLPAEVQLAFAVSMDSTYARPDTTGFYFPGEENKHLIRDIAVFVVAAAFVGYFLIKVFLEGDTEEEEEPSGGKEVPGGG